MKIDINELNLNLWIVRNKNKNLYLFQDRPFKKYGDNKVVWCSYNYCGDYCANYYGVSFQLLLPFIPDAEKYFDFSKVRWEDDRPKQLKDILIQRYIKKELY